MDPSGRYRAVYVTSQGVPDVYGENHSASDLRAVDALIEYVERKSPVESEINGSITAV